MESLYNFDPNRNLGFDAGRGLDFDGGRALDFTPNRDLGFGARGVVFRSAKTEETPEPMEVVTEVTEASVATAATRDGNRFCPYCGVAWRAGDESCWNCHSRTDGRGQVTKIPARAARPVSREWRRGVEG